MMCVCVCGGRQAEDVLFVGKLKMVYVKTQRKAQLTLGQTVENFMLVVPLAVPSGKNNGSL